MANIVSSSLVSSVQADGRSTVHETHVDLLGLKWEIIYLALNGANLNAAMATHATDLGVNLGLDEIAKNIGQVTTNGSLASTSLLYSNAAPNFAALRLAYKVATQTAAVMIGDFLSTLTDNQLGNAFGLTAGQVTTLRTNKLTPAASLASSIRSSVGQ